MLHLQNPMIQSVQYTGKSWVHFGRRLDNNDSKTTTDMYDIMQDKNTIVTLTVKALGHWTSIYGKCTVRI